MTRMERIERIKETVGNKDLPGDERIRIVEKELEILRQTQDDIWGDYKES